MTMTRRLQCTTMQSTKMRVVRLQWTVGKNVKARFLLDSNETGECSHKRLLRTNPHTVNIIINSQRPTTKPTLERKTINHPQLRSARRPKKQGTVIQGKNAKKQIRK